MEIKVDKFNFVDEVLNSDLPVVVDFWATWCGPCMMLAPTLEKFAEMNEGKIKVCKINVDEENELAVNFGIVSIPTLLLVSNGEVVKKSIGNLTLEELENFASL